MNKELNLSETVTSTIQSGRKIDAIKALREETGLDLKDAKDAVDTYIRANPHLAAPVGANTGSSFGRLVIIGIIVAAIIAIYRIFS